MVNTRGGTPQDLAQRLGRDFASLTRGIEEIPGWQIRLDQLVAAGVRGVDNRPLVLVPRRSAGDTEVGNRQRHLNKLMRVGEENGWPDDVQREYRALLEEHIARPVAEKNAIQWGGIK